MKIITFELPDFEASFQANLSFYNECREAIGQGFKEIAEQYGMNYNMSASTEDGMPISSFFLGSGVMMEVSITLTGGLRVSGIFGDEDKPSEFELHDLSHVTDLLRSFIENVRFTKFMVKVMAIRWGRANRST